MKKKVSTTETKAPEVETVIGESQAQVSEEQGKDTRTSESKEITGETQTAKQDHDPKVVQSTGQTGAGEDIVTDTEVSPASEESTPKQTTAEPVSLPEGVTPEPRNEEELHIELVRRSEFMLETYLAVSDDEGDLHGDLVLEQEVKEFCDQDRDIENLSNEALQELLETSKALIARYSPLVSKTEAMTSGKITKYRIREGMIYNIEKPAVLKLGHKWIPWFKENHKGVSQRSAQVYMSIASIPRAIAYSFLNLETLIQLERAVNEVKPTSSDPLREYLADYGLVLDPTTDPDRDQLKRIQDQVDTLVTMNQIRAVEKKNKLNLNVDEETVRKIINLGKKIDDSRIKNLALISRSAGNPNQYLKDIYENGGSEPLLIQAKEKVDSIPKLVSTLKDTVDFIDAHTEFASGIKKDDIDTLENQLIKLKTFVNNQ